MENFHISSTVLNVSTKQSFSAWTDTKRADRSCRKSPTFLHFQEKKIKKIPQHRLKSHRILPFILFGICPVIAFQSLKKKKKKSLTLKSWMTSWLLLSTTRSRVRSASCRAWSGCALERLRPENCSRISGWETQRDQTFVHSKAIERNRRQEVKNKSFYFLNRNSQLSWDRLEACFF